MNALRSVAVALALASASQGQAQAPAPSQAPADAKLAKEVAALKARLTALEKEVKQASAAAPAAEQRAAPDAEAPEGGKDEPGLAGFTLSGYLDVDYVYNFNRERGTFQFLVPIDKEDYAYDSSYMGTVALDLQKETKGGTRFRLTVVPKRSSADVVYEASIVQEASVSIPLGGDVRLLAGQIPDWQGYEYTQPTLNKLVTHNLLFDFTTPDTYVGAGLEVARGRWTVKAVLANVNTSVRAVGEDVPALVYRGDFEGGESWGLGFAGVEGPKANARADDTNPITGEAYDPEDTWLHAFEVDGWYTLGDLSLYGQVSVGQQGNAAVTADPDTGALRDARWVGASVLAAYELTPRLEGALRADYLYNRKHGGGLLDFVFADGLNGVGPDPAGDPEEGADRYAVTVGLGFTLNPNVTLKAEYRLDGATLPVFAKPGGELVKTGHLVATSVVAFF